MSSLKPLGSRGSRRSYPQVVSQGAGQGTCPSHVAERPQIQIVNPCPVFLALVLSALAAGESLCSGQDYLTLWVPAVQTIKPGCLKRGLDLPATSLWSCTQIRGSAQSQEAQADFLMCHTMFLAQLRAWARPGGHSILLPAFTANL